MDISGIIRVKKHSAFRFRFESFTFRQVKLEGSNLEFPVGKLVLALIQYIGFCGARINCRSLRFRIEISNPNQHPSCDGLDA
jgi:hypothetical protein